MTLSCRRAKDSRMALNHFCGQRCAKVGLTGGGVICEIGGQAIRAISGSARLVPHTTSWGWSSGQPQWRSSASIPQCRASSMVRMLTECSRASRTTASVLSSRRTLTPRRPRSPASAAPLGPAPTTTTSTCSGPSAGLMTRAPQQRRVVAPSDSRGLGGHRCRSWTIHFFGGRRGRADFTAGKPSPAAAAVTAVVHTCAHLSLAAPMRTQASSAGWPVRLLHPWRVAFWTTRSPVFRWVSALSSRRSQTSPFRTKM